MKLRQTQQTRQARRGFTLMEMLVVVAIIVALAGIGILYLMPQAEEGNKTKIKSDVRDITSAAKIFWINHQGTWPQSLEQLLVKDELGGPYIAKRESLYDPWNQPYKYDASGPQNNATGNANQPDVWCEAPFGIIGNWSNRIIPRQ